MSEGSDVEAAEHREVDRLEQEVAAEALEAETMQDLELGLEPLSVKAPKAVTPGAYLVVRDSRCSHQEADQGMLPRPESQRGVTPGFRETAIGEPLDVLRRIDRLPRKRRLGVLVGIGRRGDAKAIAEPRRE